MNTKSMLPWLAAMFSHHGPIGSPAAPETGIPPQPNSGRRLLLIGAALMAAAALVLPIGVIPPTRTDTFPGATPQNAVPAFWILAALSLLVGVLLSLVALVTRGRTRLSLAVVSLGVFLALMVAFGLTGPAFAFWGHSPVMHGASILLFLCMAASLSAAALALVAEFRMPSLTQPARGSSRLAIETGAACALSLMTAFVASILLIVVGELAGKKGGFGIGDAIATALYNGGIIAACFFICRKYPRSVWYVPLICNIFGIFAACVEPSFWHGDWHGMPMWLSMPVGWVFSIGAAIGGASKGTPR